MLWCSIEAQGHLYLYIDLNVTINIIDVATPIVYQYLTSIMLSNDIKREEQETETLMVVLKIFVSFTYDACLLFSYSKRVLNSENFR
jgi:hypothetical protein